LVSSRTEPGQGVTELLTQCCAAGDKAAYGELFSTIHESLRQRVHLLLRRDATATLSTTALVHETFLKMSGRRLEPKDQSQFYAIASRAMRQVFMTAAPDRRALKHSCAWEMNRLALLTQDGKTLVSSL